MWPARSFHSVPCCAVVSIEPCMRLPPSSPAWFMSSWISLFSFALVVSTAELFLSCLCPTTMFPLFGGLLQSTSTHASHDSDHLIPRILLRALLINTWVLLASALIILQVSEPYSNICITFQLNIHKLCILCTVYYICVHIFRFACKLITSLFYIF